MLFLATGGFPQLPLTIMAKPPFAPPHAPDPVLSIPSSIHLPPSFSCRSVLFLAFGGFPQLPLTIMAKSVFYKHRDNFFIPAYAQGIAIALVQVRAVEKGLGEGRGGQGGEDEACCVSYRCCNNNFIPVYAQCIAIALVQVRAVTGKGGRAQG